MNLRQTALPPKEALHREVLAAVTSAIASGMTPQEVGTYFDEAARGLKVTLVWRPSSDLFLEMIALETA